MAVVVENQQNEDQVDFIRLRPKKSPSQNRNSILPQSIRQSLAYIQESLSDGILGFITIKVILWDILISLADIISDFLQGYTLFCTPGKSAPPEIAALMKSEGYDNSQLYLGEI